MNSKDYQIGLLLGSNIAPEWNLPAAYMELSRRFQVIRRSRIWQSPAVGSEGPDFLNMAVLITSSMDAESLKGQVLRPIESQLGRIRTRDKNAPRPIDIDVITVGGQVIDPDLWNFAHLAVPFAEILPEIRIPNSQDTLLSKAIDLRQQSIIAPRMDASGYPIPFPLGRQFEQTSLAHRSPIANNSQSGFYLHPR